MKKNVKTIKVVIPNEGILKRIKTTPTLNNLLRSELKVGENVENVNHSQFSRIQRILPVMGVIVTEI